MEDEKGHGPQYPAHGGAKITGDRPRGLETQGARVTQLLVILFLVCKHKAPWAVERLVLNLLLRMTQVTGDPNLLANLRR